MAKMGRPTKYSDKLALRMCSEIAGGLSVSKLCLLSWAPTSKTFYNWLMDNCEFFDRYIKARESQAHSLLDDITDIADDSEDIRKARLRIDARVIYAEKCAPTKYSPKQQIEHDGKLEISIVSFAGASKHNVPRETL